MGTDLVFHEEGRIAVITMRWPEVRNAMGPPEAEVVRTAVVEAGPASALILTGEGAFSAGGDLKQFLAISESTPPDELEAVVYTRFQGLMRALRDFPGVTIAAVDGAAVGLGFDLALGCDLRLVGERGWFMQGWARAGLIAGTAGSAFLERIRPGLTVQLLDQRRLDGAGAAALGVAEAARPSALEIALERARMYARYDPALLEAYVALTRPLRWPDEAYLKESARRQAEFLGSEAFRRFARETLAATP